MKAAFHYVVKTKRLRYENANEIRFLEFEEKFENEEPILAREAAFNYYQNYIEVLLQSKGKNFISDKQARIDITSGLKGDWEEEQEAIGIFLVVDEPVEGRRGVICPYKINEEILIHRIGSTEIMHSSDDGVIYELAEEYQLYKLHKYDTKNHNKKVVYCNADEWGEGYLGNGEWLDDSYHEPNEYEILQTPFDWTGYDKPYWWGGSEEEYKVEEIQNVPLTIQGIIDGGEGNQVEFKPSLIYNFKTERAGVSVKVKIAATICAFLNAKGGFLLIGVRDDKSIGGLAYDFGLSNGKDSKDFFQLEFDEMIEQFISTSIINFVSGEFYQIDGREIFVVTVQPSKRRPIFLNGQNGKEFFVRKLASSKRINDIEEIVNYCVERWQIVPE